MRKLRAENQILIEKSDEVNADTVLELERVEQEMAETFKQVAQERHRLTESQEARDEAQQASAAAEVKLKASLTPRGRAAASRGESKR